MWPTSMAGSMVSRPPHRAGVAFLRLADVGEDGLVVASAMTPRVCQPSRLAPATYCRPEAVVRDHLDVDTDRADRAATGPEGRANLVFSRRTIRRLEHGREFSSLSRSSPRTSARTRRSPTTTGIAFDVAVASMPSRSASASMVVTPGSRRPRWQRAPRGAWPAARSAGGFDVGEVVAVLTAHQLVLARSRRREEAE